jgi:hypothetical protein
LGSSRTGGAGGLGEVGRVGGRKQEALRIGKSIRKLKAAYTSSLRPHTLAA